MSQRLFGRILLPVVSNTIRSIPRRTAVAATSTRQLSETTAVRRDARQFVKMLKQDGLLDGLIIGFVGLFGFIHYTVSESPFYIGCFAYIDIQHSSIIIFMC